MKYLDILEETITALSANKVRSGLTILGIIIGISSVIAMISIGQGAQSSIQSGIQSLGSNLIIVMPGAQRGPGFIVSAGRGGAKTLTQSDADAIRTEVQNVTDVASEVSSRQQVTAHGTNTNTSIDGVTASYAAIRNNSIDQGAFISDGDNQSLAKVAVLGPTAMTDLFGADADPANVIGQHIRIKGMLFTVIGITTSKGGSGFGNADDMIFVPARTAELYLTGDHYLTTIDVQASDSSAMSRAQSDILALLLDRHHLSDPAAADFTTLNQNDIIATAASVTNTFTILLASVAGISLIVGGIGIMNMMLTNVTERTREIGLRKAIGATSRDINLQFLAEAVALTGIGGVLGVALGWAISFGINELGLIWTSVSLMSILLAFGVSAAIGIIFGYYPARRAAELNPIEALRYE